MGRKVQAQCRRVPPITLQTTPLHYLQMDDGCAAAQALVCLLAADIKAAFSGFGTQLRPGFASDAWPA